MNSKKTISITIGVILLVGIIGGGIWMVTAKSRRQAAVAQSFTNFRQAASYHVTADIAVKLPEEMMNNQKRPLQAVAMTIQGDIVRSETTPEFTGSMRAEAKGPGMVLFSEGELRSFADSVAFRLDSLPSLLNPSGNLQKKWTYVQTPVFITNNPEAIMDSVVGAAQQLTYTGKDTVPGTTVSAEHYTGSIPPEQEDALAGVLAKTASGNTTFDMIARMLQSYTIQSADVWVKDHNIRGMKLTFVKDQNDPATSAAHLQLSFSDFGKAVAIERPPQELTVRPEVFSQLFRTPASVSLKTGQ